MVSNASQDGRTPDRAVSPFQLGLSYGIYPVMVLSGAAALVYGASVIPDIRGFEWHFMLAAAVYAGGTAAIFERIHPYSNLWRETKGDVWADILTTITGNFMAPINAVILGLIGIWAAFAVRDTLGMGLWPQSWPLGVQLILALIAAEFGQYWAHRWFHVLGAGWRFHAIHHSAPRLYWLNTGRFHLVDAAIQNFMTGIPLALLGANEKIIVLVAAFGALHGFYQHANIHMKFGWLNWVISSTELHRIHHSLDKETCNHNYGTNLIVWDMVFGTWRPPQDDGHDPRDVGIMANDYPVDFIGLFLSPFRWKRYAREQGEG